MTPLPDLPEEPQLICQISRSSSNLTLRLVADFHPDFQYIAHTIEAENIANSQEFEKALTALKEAKESAYFRWVSGALHITSESGDEIKIEAASFAVNAGPLSESELRNFINLVYSWYLSEHKFGTGQAAKVERIRELLNEQARRISVKAPSHETGGAAATLYKQQSAFIERVLREIET